MRVTDVGTDWRPVTPMCRPPANAYFKCWAYHRSGQVVLANGDDWGWGKNFTHWLPASLRHTAFCAWEWDEAHRPAPPEVLPA